MASQEPHKHEQDALEPSSSIASEQDFSPDNLYSILWNWFIYNNQDSFDEIMELFKYIGKKYPLFVITIYPFLKPLQGSIKKPIWNFVLSLNECFTFGKNSSNLTEIFLRFYSISEISFYQQRFKQRFQILSKEDFGEIFQILDGIEHQIGVTILSVKSVKLIGPATHQAFSFSFRHYDYFSFSEVKRNATIKAVECDPSLVVSGVCSLKGFDPCLFIKEGFVYIHICNYKIYSFTQDEDFVREHLTKSEPLNDHIHSKWIISSTTKYGSQELTHTVVKLSHMQFQWAVVQFGSKS